MRTFSEFAVERPVMKFLTSSIGMLFYVVGTTNRAMVRKFSPGDSIDAYMGIYYSVKNWIDHRPEVSAVVEMAMPFEVGVDFYARNHQMYTSTNELLDEESNVELPAEFFAHQNLVKAALKASPGTRNAVVERVIQRSLLEPTGKTFFDFNRKKLMMVEPKILPDDIESWKNLKN